MHSPKAGCPLVTALASPARRSSWGCTPDQGGGWRWGAALRSRWSYIRGDEGRGFCGVEQRACRLCECLVGAGCGGYRAQLVGSIFALLPGWDKGSSLRGGVEKEAESCSCKKGSEGGSGGRLCYGLSYKHSYLRSAMGLRTMSYYFYMPSTNHGDQCLVRTALND